MSQGGGLCLAYVTRKAPPPVQDNISLVAGVVATSPLLLLTKPTSSVLRVLARIGSGILPAMLVPAPVDPYVSPMPRVLPCCIHADIRSQALSHDKSVCEANAQDPLCPQKGSVKGIHDMLTGVSCSDLSC